MKALRITGIAFLSLFIISCASTPSTDENQISELLNENQTEVIDETEVEKNDDLSDENKYEKDSTFEKDEIELIDDEIENNEIDILHQELDEIVEPEIIDLEPPLEDEFFEDEPELESEIIPDAEKDIEELPPVEANFEDIKNEVKENEIEIVVTDEELNSVETEQEPVQIEDEISVVTDDSDDIEVLDGDSESSKQEIITKEIKPSRSVKINLMEYVDVVYPGNGWIFMGLTDNSKDLTYNGRQIGTENTKFSLQAKTPGTKILHFYKNDPVKGEYIDDYVEVIVSKEKGNPKTHTLAEEYKSPLPETAAAPKTESSAPKSNPTPKTESVTPTSVPTPKTEPLGQKTAAAPKTELSSTSVDSPKTDISIPEEEPSEKIDTEAVFKEAKQAFESKNYIVASNKLNLFLEHSTSNRDEALYLLGQIYEAPGQNQNIQAALNSYTTLITNYPASKFWDNANKRIIYLKRFYMEGR